jgi:hypothetical protein
MLNPMDSPVSINSGVREKEKIPALFARIFRME